MKTTLRILAAAAALAIATPAFAQGGGMGGSFGGYAPPGVSAMSPFGAHGKGADSNKQA